MLRGPILTQANTLDQIAQCIKAGGYDALKVVTGWGLFGGWNDLTMHQVATLVPNLIVRTTAGDPSYAGGVKALPIDAQILVELRDWYATRPDIFIEIGNEPNISPSWDDSFAWAYRWHLERTITLCRTMFPKAKLISPALILDEDKRPRRWLEICGDMMHRCDLIGVHAYEFDAFVPSEQRHGSTRHFQTAASLHRQFFVDKQWIVTEYGINDHATPATTKGTRYANLLRRRGVNASLLPANVIGGLHYHYCGDHSLQAEYHIAPDGDVAFRKAWEAK